MTEEEYSRVININQVSVFLGMKTVFPLNLEKQKKVERSTRYLLVGGLFSQQGAIAYSASQISL